MIAGAFHVDPIVAALVAGACVAGIALTRRRGSARRAARVALQVLAGAALLAALSLRDVASPTTVIVLTPGATAAQVAEAWRGAGDAAVVALPGVAVDAGQAARVVRVPDLASELRRHAATRLVVLGEGLREHDRAAVGAVPLAFVPAPSRESPAIVAAEAPAQVAAGAGWSVQGRIARGADAGGKPLRVVLRDPAGNDIAASVPGEDGAFALRAVARAAGTLAYELQLRRGDATLQSLPVPLRAQARPGLRALLLAAAPSPEVKYLRRWALDAGVALEARIALAPGLAQRRGAAALGAAEMAELDLLVVDERSWPQLAALRPPLREAVRAGLGVLVRTTGPVPAAVAREWEALGLPVTNAARPVPLDPAHEGDTPDARTPVATTTRGQPRDQGAGAPVSTDADDSRAGPALERSAGSPAFADADNAGSDLPDARDSEVGHASEPLAGLHAWPVPPAADHVPLVTAADGTVAASWRAEGRGRIGSWRLTDSHRWVTRGERERHATLWSAAWSTLARARAQPGPVLPARAVTGERATVCGLAAPAAITAPSGARIPLAPVAGCAALWPREAGWHRVEGAGTEGEFHVHDRATVAPLLAAETRAATRALARAAPTQPVESPRDPDSIRAAWLALWLAFATLLWALERRP